MGMVEDLGFLGAPIADPAGTALFIDGQILTRRQKASALRAFLTQQGLGLNETIRTAAQNYIEFF